jgi:hypothetical protein
MKKAISHAIKRKADSLISNHDKIQSTEKKLAKISAELEELRFHVRALVLNEERCAVMDANLHEKQVKIASLEIHQKEALDYLQKLRAGSCGGGGGGGGGSCGGGSSRAAPRGPQDPVHMSLEEIRCEMGASGLFGCQSGVLMTCDELRSELSFPLRIPPGQIQAMPRKKAIARRLIQLSGRFMTPEMIEDTIKHL